MPHYRSIFISDLHLGSRACQADKICEFLKHNTCDVLYLVGDIIDGWRLRRKWYFPQEHINVIRRILTASKRDTQVVYIVGNHDEALRKFLSFDITFGNIKVANEIIHHTKTNRRLLVTHGDGFDSLMFDAKWLMHFGDFLYNVVIWTNIHLNGIRKFFGMRHWSLAKYLKSRTKQAVSYINSFEEKVAEHCEKNGFDGVICGHIHTPVVKKIQGVDYYNCGDWTDHCTAIVETVDGEIKLVEFDGENTSGH